MKLLHCTLYNLFIQTQKTPNPNFLKFLPTNKVVMGDLETIDIRSQQQASQISPLARKFFRIKGVVQVFYGKNYISIAKAEEYNWTQLKPLIFSLIQDHYQSEEPLIVNRSTIDDIGINQDDTQTVKLIKQILFSRVRPFVQDDGGDVKFVSFNPESGVLKLKMEGSCSGCPSSSATLRNGILKAMKYYVGDVKNVVSIEQEQNLTKQKNQLQKYQNVQANKNKNQPKIDFF